MTVQIMIVEDDLELIDQYRTLIQGRSGPSLEHQRIQRQDKVS